MYHGQNNKNIYLIHIIGHYIYWMLTYHVFTYKFDPHLANFFLSIHRKKNCVESIKKSSESKSNLLLYCSQLPFLYSIKFIEQICTRPCNKPLKLIKNL